ncbi:hypothetical protein DL96DRAFT_238047 [Flagelloscypha sp. PMI_526]|nr:hypothetical protein DL96DRAFT_238047 [Flagelloscypha sp. PMI_526]
MKFSSALLSLLLIAVSAAPVRREAEVDVDSVFFVENGSWDPANARRELDVDAAFIHIGNEWIDVNSAPDAVTSRELTVDAGFLVTTPEHWAGADA